MTSLLTWNDVNTRDMMMDKITNNQSIFITLDVDVLLFDKLHHIVEMGFSVVEINSVDQGVLSSVLERFPRLRIGAGNVTNTQQLEDCYEAGIHFITSPGLLPSIAQTANVYSINYLPGVATLTEAMQAVEIGCQHVRPFPANLYFCTLLNKYIPRLRLFPAEIELNDIDHFLHIPAVAAISIINPELEQLRAFSTTTMA